MYSTHSHKHETDSIFLECLSILIAAKNQSRSYTHKTNLQLVIYKENIGTSIKSSAQMT